MTDVVQRANVRMIERGNRARFALKALPRVGFLRQMLRQNLDGHVAPEARVPRAIHLAHSTRTDGRLNFIRPEFASDGQHHRFFNSAGQFVTSVSGSEVPCAPRPSTTNLFPSGLTS